MRHSMNMNVITPGLSLKIDLKVGIIVAEDVTINRFWRDEDIEEVIGHLKEKKPPQNVPIWIQDLMKRKKVQEPSEDSKEY